MLEARSFLESFDKITKILDKQNPVYKGDYEIHDIIFSSKDPSKTLTDEFLRLRIYLKSIWDEKAVILAIKNTELKEKGKNSTIPFKMEFDSREEAEDYINQNFLDKFEYSYEFSRIGWQYKIVEDGVDLEDIEGHLSIEVKSKTEEGLQRLIELFDLKDIIVGPSVVKVKELLKK